MSSNVIVGNAVSSLKVGNGLKISERLHEIWMYRKITWLQNYDEALEKAYTTSGSQAKGARIVMAFFTGSDWCSYCKALTIEVFNSSSFTAWFNQHFIVPVVLDYPNNNKSST